LLREPDRFDQAAATVERAYTSAVQLKNEVVINQSLMERCALYLDMRIPQRADAMLPRSSRQ
jgi:hypothetical protein